MADEGANWAFKLIDGISGPAKAMQAAIAGVVDGLKHGDESIKGAHEGTSKHTESAFGKMGESVKGFAEGFFFVTESIKTAAEAIEGVFDKLKEGTEQVFELSDFRRNALIGLDAMLSTGYQATAVLERLEGWATQTGLAKDTFQAFGKQLLGDGFKEGELKPLLAALSDVAGTNQGKVEASQQLLQMFGRIKETDKVNARELVQFGELGIKPDLIYAALAKQQHLSIANAKAAFIGGGVAGNDAINAILGVVQTGMDKGGPLGKAGQGQAAGSVFAQVIKIKDAVSTMFEGVNEGPFANAMARVANQLRGDEAKRFASQIELGFAKAADWVSKLDFVKIGDSLGTVVSALGTAADFVGKVFNGFVEGWQDMQPAVSAMGDAIGSVFGSDGDGGGADIKMFAESIGNVVGGFVIAAEVVVFCVGLIGKAVVVLVEVLADLVDRVVTIGTDIVGGLWSGIKAAWGEMMSEFHGLVSLLPASVKHVLGIASPSRVFAGLGMQTMEGFTVGMRSVNVHEHVSRMVSPYGLGLSTSEMRVNARGLGSDHAFAEHGLGHMRPNAMNVADFGARGGGARAGGHAPQVSVVIQIDGSKDPEATAHAVADKLRSVLPTELARTFDELRIEMGA